MNAVNITLIAALVIYFFIALRFFINYSKQNKALETVTRKEVSLFFWENYIINKTGIDRSYIKPVVYTSRALAVVVMITASLLIGAIALTLVVGFIIVVVIERKSASLIHEAGVNHIGLVNAFLDSYIPSLSSGLSNDQAMLKYINAINDEELFEWWTNRENPEYINPVKWKRVIEIYNIIKFNEDRGIGDSLPIIEQMQQDLNVKQQYYNEYSAKMGEVQPIVFSYYFFIPVLLFMSFKETGGFWFSWLGYLSAVGLLVLFLTSQFMVFKIKASTVKVIF